MPGLTRRNGFLAKLRRRALPFVLAGGLAFGANSKAAPPVQHNLPSKPAVVRAVKVEPIIGTVYVPSVSSVIQKQKTKSLSGESSYPQRNLAGDGWVPVNAKKPVVSKLSVGGAVRRSAVPKFLETNKSISVRMPTNHISVEQINLELAKMGSPIAGKGDFVLRIAREYNVDPAFFLAVARQESGGGSAGLARKTKNMCNVRWTQKSRYPNLKDFNVYPSWEKGVVGFFYQISRGNYYLREGNHYVDGIIKKYAPSNENNTGQYVRNVEEYMRRLGRS